jgi:hypothetical protein
VVGFTDEHVVFYGQLIADQGFGACKSQPPAQPGRLRSAGKLRLAAGEREISRCGGCFYHDPSLVASFIG